MKRYRCFYLLAGDEPSLTRSIQLHAADASRAARLAASVTGCAMVTDVVRMGDVE
ncbi:hypothetical protein BGLT_06783 [Caballeronia glathei]|uniref:hypothetical protein n=1 Tax=Caballeronia glathei TaxID=60547 RepID=UPI000507CF10|nr:hypothetical protein [Caballeronia glathei]CDY77977.1 hypothetical protein BGLT_06783 [Caballeronia glathei]